MLRRFPLRLVLLFGSCLLFPVVLLLTGALFVLFLAIAVVFFLWKQFLLSFRSLSKGFPVLGKLFALLLSGKVAVVFSLVLFCS